MEPMPSMEVVIQALNSLYRGNDNDAREAASKWLMEMQKSVHAWHIADQLLHMNADEESSYFAAQTMRTKIQFSFHEVPVETYQALCSSLMSHCSKIRKDTKHTIVTQLSLALADLALKVASWKNAVKSFIQEFSQKEDHWDFLLELLSVFPEEINCRQLKLGENRRNEVYAELKETAPDFIQFLFRMVEARQNDVTTLSRVFKCLSSWLNIFAIPEQVFLSCNLLHLAFLAVASQNCDSLLHKNAADCICAAIVTVEELECNRNLAEALFKEIHGLVDSYHLSVAMNDIDKCINYARIFTEMGESVLEPMAETPNEGFGDFKVLEVLLTCVGHHNYQVADVTFAFWNHLSDYLYEDKNRAILNLFKPYICRLITALCRLCKYDESNDDVKDDDSDFEDFRQNALDLVKDVQFIVGPDEIVGQLNESLKQHVPNQSWATYEAALFIMQSPAKKVSEKDSKVTSSLLEFIITSVLPSVHHVALQNTFLNLVASLQRWFKENKMYLEMVLPIIIQGFNNPKLAPTSAQCLQQLCETCSTFFVNDLHTLFTILEAVESINLPQASTIKLLEAASSTLSCLEVNKVMEGLQHLCNPSIMNLKRIVETVTEIKNNTRDDPSMWLDRLASIFNFILNRAVQLDLAQDQMNPCFEFFIQSWPTLSDIMKKFSSDGRVIEHSCRCMRNGIRSFGRNNSSLILPIVTLMVEIYKEHLHPCCLYMGSVMVDAYAGHQQNVPIFLSMLDEFSGKTFAMTEQINGLVNYPDVVDDFFRLALRFVEQCPQAFLEFAGCKTILLSAIHAVSIPHSDANATVVRFLQTVIKLAQIKIGADSSQKHRQNLVLGLLNDHGLELVSAIIDACLLKVPSRLISYLASTIYELLKIDREATTIWLQEALNRLPLQSTAGCIAVTHEQKQEFLTSITSTENEDDIGDLYKDFSMYFK